MNRELKRKWVEALRSGQYKQGRGNLHVRTRDQHDNRVDAYCCLGVLCNVSGVGDWCAVGDARFIYHAPDLGIKSGTGFLLDIGELLGADEAVDMERINQEADPDFHLETEHASLSYLLTYLNDTLRWDFDQIADFIELYVSETDTPLPISTVQVANEGSDV